MLGNNTKIVTYFKSTMQEVWTVGACQKDVVSYCFENMLQAKVYCFSPKCYGLMTSACLRIELPTYSLTSQGNIKSKVDNLIRLVLIILKMLSTRTEDLIYTWLDFYSLWLF